MENVIRAEEYKKKMKFKKFRKKNLNQKKQNKKEEEFNFDKIERTEIEQIKENITNLQKLANEQAEHIQILKQAIEIHQLMFNELHQENINLKRNKYNCSKYEYGTLNEDYPDERFDPILKDYIRQTKQNIYEQRKRYKPSDNEELD
ncbi:7172_t:CDS:2 [Ambispora leptoticha]|uniref:7172_t:CDS:1 n=1 Tax=Ambispora leptoticha TaxID=144679 RepID=A0A9N9DC97_9GLOM|nr:7172_t:CDS:2 [Ambispora leptoticha]